MCSLPFSVSPPLHPYFPSLFGTFFIFQHLSLKILQSPSLLSNLNLNSAQHNGASVRIRPQGAIATPLIMQQLKEHGFVRSKPGKPRCLFHRITVLKNERNTAAVMHLCYKTLDTSPCKLLAVCSPICLQSQTD